MKNQMIGVQLTVPLYSGGYRSARQEEALGLAEKARAEADRSRQQIAQQTRAAWLGITVGASRIAALAETAKASQARLDSTRFAHGIGDRTTLELLSAENDAANAEIALLQARIGVLVDRLRLAALAGRLDEAQLRAVNARLQATREQSDRTAKAGPQSIVAPEPAVAPRRAVAPSRAVAPARVAAPKRAVAPKRASAPPRPANSRSKPRPGQRR